MKKSLLPILVIAILACLASAAPNLVVWRLLTDDLGDPLHTSNDTSSSAATDVYNGLDTEDVYCKLLMTTESSAPATVTASYPSSTLRYPCFG